MSYQITDINGETFTTDYLYEETFERIFPNMSDEISAAIDGLIDALNRREYTGGYEMFLGITIDQIDYDPMEDMQFEPEGNEINITGNGYELHAYQTRMTDWCVWGTIGDCEVDNEWAGVTLATFGDLDDMILGIICDELA